MATVAEVAPDIYLVNVEIPGSPVTYSFCIIKDEQPVLVETGFGRLFDESLAAVKQVIDPARLRYIVVPHFEGDECGALNHCLNVAPLAQPVCSPIAARTSILDFAIREPVVAEEGKLLELGQRRLGFVITPYVHLWERLLAYEPTTGTVFTSDVFIQPGTGPATTDQDLTEPMLATYRMVGIFPSRAHLNAALDKLEALNPRVLACHHGSVIGGRIPTYFQALREHDVTGVTEWNPMRGY